MADHPQALSQETLHQVMASEGTDSTHIKTGSLSHHRNTQPTDMAPRPLLHLQSIEEGKGPFPPSRRSSIMSILNAPFSSRRNSLAAGGRRLSIGPWMHCGRVSFSGLPLFEPIRETRYENTYKTHPDEGCKFNTSQVQQVLESILSTYLGDARYNPANSGQIVQNLSDLIRNRVKEITPPRYKLVCNVFLGQQANQGLRIGSQSLWDVENDNFASATFTNSSLFAVATVHGLYFE
ncbi:dynein light chain Tctex-type 4 [Rhineura floridana]|uniref:dynein light chain Tctex-type 4 n=1 Tax=Rhineura floridana TaxID=261503 RepID=UPI002AC88F21|nr:dynein light chain Tctex-type 4 [Rhineura floridana]XP_061486421.1 dynein light chain Tctex-type 4 [Rhineura floridana]XP_061486422.1 dynein light chain Tctex-type 4 [Rhineura floridana]XP_061486423.1 dynein light chain Tctex-type 4 [Rhineura floridana]XP_061486424.1 dynein light chain Tctex-type 4 [Rhineura floridana]XP_061486425.1 dynein light chain Tctex-type 4 [Rhineura floridana]